MKTQIDPWTMIEIDKFVEFAIERINKRHREHGDEIYSTRSVKSFLIILKTEYRKKFEKELEENNGKD